jgi:hypothetical protein
MTGNNPPLTITARLSTITPEERRRRLAAVYQILLDAAARADNGRQPGNAYEQQRR